MKSIFRTYIPVLLFTGLITLADSCKTRPARIIVSTAEVTGISQSGAMSGGVVDARKAGSITARGVCWSISADPTIGDDHTLDGNGTGNFASILTGLKPGTVYYLRAYAITAADTSYGNTNSFTTQDYGMVKDIEGNEYNTITIGTQIWMAKNLGTTRYNDGKAIPLVTAPAAWAGLSAPAYCWYKNDEATYKDFYGALYNGYAVNTGKLCPEGWHVPTDIEWNVLTAYLGGEEIAGGKLKEAGTSRWVRPNSGATNKSNFTGLPGGLRYSDGEYHDFGFSGYWWSSTQYSASRAFFRFLYHQDSCIFRFDNVKQNGFSVRCLKDD